MRFIAKIGRAVQRSRLLTEQFLSPLFSPSPYPLRVDALRTFAVLNVLAMHKILRRNCDRDTKKLLHAKLKQFPWHMQVCLLNMGLATRSTRACPAGGCM